MLVLGVDPGLTGALALLCSRRGLLEVADIPTTTNGQATGTMLRWVDVDALRELLAGWSLTHHFATESVHAAIERPIAMPTLPAQTIASQFDTFGVLRATLRSYCDEVVAVNPADWKRRFGVRADKEAARACALRLYPAAPLSRKRDHNRADSLLIAHNRLMELA